MKRALAILSFVVAIVLVFINMFMPPEGEVHESIIYIFAQLLLYSATLQGVQVLLHQYLKNKNGNEN